MKKLLKLGLLKITLMLAVVPAQAAYFRLLDVHAIQQSASIDIDPNGKVPTSGITDIAIMTHSTADGTIMPAFCRNSWCPPENHAFTLGGGGNVGFTNGKLQGNSVMSGGWTVNAAPQLLGWAVQGIGNASAPWLQGLKSQILSSNGNGLRIGYSLDGNLVNNGTFIWKQIFPGQGFGDILKNASRIKVGYYWTWK